MAKVEKRRMRCENDFGQHEFVNVMFLSDFPSFDDFFNHLGIFSNNWLSSIHHRSIMVLCVCAEPSLWLKVDLEREKMMKKLVSRKRESCRSRCAVKHDK